MSLTLIPPAVAHEAAVMALYQAFSARNLLLHGASIAMFDTYRDWLTFSQSPAGTPAPDGSFLKVTDSTYLGTDAAGEVVGLINIRHELNDFLRQYAGHIGYSVHPAHWGKGYATDMLSQALEITDKLGINPVLISCQTDNIASARVIEKNGGKHLATRSLNDKVYACYAIERPNAQLMHSEVQAS